MRWNWRWRSASSYGFQLRSDNDDNRRIFASLRALSAHVEQHKAA